VAAIFQNGRHRTEIAQSDGNITVWLFTGRFTAK